MAIALSLLLAGCCSKAPKDDVRARPPEPYVRVTNTDSNLIQLQIAVRQFVPAHGHGPAIWLTGVSHIGDSNYYAALQRHLNTQTLVLFEGVSPRIRTEETPAPRALSANGSPGTATRPAADDVPGLQSSMAASLGLVFQLTAIDYQRPNFRNCDLSIPELRQLLVEGEASSGTSGAEASFEGVLQLMQGGSFLDSVLQVGLRLLGASPKLRALGRLALIDVIGEIQGDFSHLHGLPPDMKQLLQVLLQRRNQKVMTRLKSEVGRLGRHDTISVFYGIAHMPDLEKRLREELHYRPAVQRWFTAFSVNPAQAGVSQVEREFLHAMIKQQLDQFQGH